MTAELELLHYLNEQFPATTGHIPLKEKINAVARQGMAEAAGIAADAWNDNQTMTNQRDQAERTAAVIRSASARRQFPT